MPDRPVLPLRLSNPVWSPSEPHMCWLIDLAESTSTTQFEFFKSGLCSVPEGVQAKEAASQTHSFPVKSLPRFYFLRDFGSVTWGSRQVWQVVRHRFNWKHSIILHELDSRTCSQVCSKLLTFSSTCPKFWSYSDAQWSAAVRLNSIQCFFVLPYKKVHMNSISITAVSHDWRSWWILQGRTFLQPPSTVSLTPLLFVRCRYDVM
jgi:hypothetical protein